MNHTGSLPILGKKFKSLAFASILSLSGFWIKPVIESGSISLNFGTIKEISTIGIGERVCIDTTSLLQSGEGMLCGSFSNTFTLIHAETIDSEFVPTRPFRVNAGSIHSYILMKDNTTKYISELKSGDEILIVNKNI